MHLLNCFVAKAKKLIPEVEEYMFVGGGTAGVRAQAISRQGELVMDFNIIKESCATADMYAKYSKDYKFFVFGDF